MPQLIAIGAVVVLIVLLITFWYITVPLLILALQIWLMPKAVRRIRKRRYFASAAFAAHKAEIAGLTTEHNEIMQCVAGIRDRDSFEIGAAGTGRHSHLATFENTSAHNYKRERNVASYAAENVYNCSLQVVRNAAGNPIKYVPKYFDIKTDEQTLANVEALGKALPALSLPCRISKRASRRSSVWSTRQRSS